MGDYNRRSFESCIQVNVLCIETEHRSLLEINAWYYNVFVSRLWVFYCIARTINSRPVQSRFRSRKIGHGINCVFMFLPPHPLNPLRILLS